MPVIKQRDAREGMFSGILARAMPRLRDTAYPRLKSILTAYDLNAAFTPTNDELLLARRSTKGAAAQLGFLVLLKLCRAPYFDQFVGVQVSDHQFTEQDLAVAIPVSFPGRPNSANHKIQENEQLIGQLQPAGPDKPASPEIIFRAGTKSYFDIKDLAKSL